MDVRESNLGTSARQERLRIPAVARVRARGRRVYENRTLWALASLSVFVGIWEISTRLSPHVFLPPFTAVIQAWLELAQDGTLLAAVLVSVQALAIGFGLALVFGLVLGLLMGVSEQVEDVLSMYVSAALAVPSVAYIALILIWLGTGLTARTAIVFEYAVLVIILNTMAGVKTVDRSLVEMGRSLPLPRKDLFAKVVLPGAFPSIFAGVRLGLGRAVLGMVNAEMLLVLVGMGGLIKYYGASFQLDFLLALIMTIALIALVLQGILERIQGRMFAWRPSEASGTGLGRS